ncbi:DUF1801 domain-containing protein [Gordonia sp. CPCC 206044]|uniref:DUF1801 domain-containing protein n=1 Tax=Gordonia sp. CPCC 206044 TaxID=3140793 RepID=UPI003AF37D50
MAQQANKTVATTASVQDFVADLDCEQQRDDCGTLITLMARVTGQPPAMWGSAIIGFGSHHYVYDSGREGDMPALAFSPRKGKFALYITDDAGRYPDLRARLGKHKTAKSCIYIKRLSDVDGSVLEELLEAAFRDVPSAT